MIPIIFIALLSTFSLTQQLLVYSQPYFLMGIRMTIAGTLLLLYRSFITRTPIAPRSKHHYGLFLRAILCAVFIPYCLRYWALQQPSTPLTPFLYNSGLYITYLIAIITRKERISSTKIVALLLGLCALAIFHGIPLTTYLHAEYGLPEIALLLSVISFSYGWLIIRTLIVDLRYDATHINTLTMLGGGILGLCTALASESQPYMTNIAASLPLLAIVIVISNCITHNYYAHLLRHYSLTMLQYGYFAVPLVTTIVRTAYTQQSLPLSLQSSLVCLLIGFILFYQQEKGYRISPTIAQNNYLSR